MKLSLLAKDLFSCSPYENLDISSVTDCSDGVTPGALFVALRGRRSDGHAYLNAAAARGALCAVVCAPVENAPIPTFLVTDTREVFGRLCSNFYGNPSKDLILTGITGTNGKTSTAYMLDHCLRSCGISSALIGTVGTDDGATFGRSTLTTPAPDLLHRIFGRAKENGCTHTGMEVSSQSLDQSRTAGIDFELGVFTNLTVDHLDYHGSMQAYRDAKLKLFAQCRRFLVNGDSDYAAPFLAFNGAKSFSVTHKADFTAHRIRMTGNGVTYSQRSPLGSREVFLPVWGRFSVYNSLGALAAAELLGLDPDRCAAALASFPGVPGRMESVGENLPFRLLIDYAHTPDGLENVLRSLRETTVGRLILLFGCGGDRDAGKRPEMGRIASRFADYVIVTNDNPRSEDPQSIIDRILQGMQGSSYRVIPDRTEAIRAAIRLAKASDTVLLAGKGHETSQILSDRTVHCDEREIARKILKEEGY